MKKTICTIALASALSLQGHCAEQTDTRYYELRQELAEAQARRHAKIKKVMVILSAYFAGATIGFYAGKTHELRKNSREQNSTNEK